MSPGLIDTQPKPLPPSMADSLGRRIPALPLARPGEPHEVADLTPTRPSRGSYAARQLGDLAAVITGAPVRYPDTMPTMRSAAHVQHVLDAALQATGGRQPVPG